MKRGLSIFGVVALAIAAICWWQLDRARTRPEGRDIVVLIQAPPITFDPVATMELDSAFVGNAAHATLVRLDAAGREVPVLAERIDVEGDAMSATVTLRKGCLFWDGTPVTAQDAAESLLRLKKSANPLNFTASRISSIKAVDALTFVVTFSAPEPAFAQQVANLQAAITKRGTDLLPKQPFDQQVVGAGAWIPVPAEMEAGARFTFRRNPGFPSGGKAEKLTFIVKSESQPRLSAFQSGAAHVLRLRGPEVREALVDETGVLKPRPEFSKASVQSIAASDGSAMLVNWKNPALAQIPEVDRAPFLKSISTRIPRAALAKKMLAANPLTSIVPGAAGGPPPADSLTPSPVPALGNLKLEVEILAANDGASRELASIAQTAMREVGLVPTLRFTDIGSMVASVAKQQHQFCITYFEMPVPGPEGWLMFFDAENPFSAFGQPLPGVRTKINAARGVLDQEARQKAWRQIIKDVDDIQTGWVPLFSRNAVVMTSSGLETVFIDLCGTPVWTSLSFRDK